MLTDRQQQIADCDMLGMKEEASVLRELERLGVENTPYPDVAFCRKCWTGLAEGGGYAGETIIYCPRCGDTVWEDSEAAIRNVY